MSKAKKETEMIQEFEAKEKIREKQKKKREQQLDDVDQPSPPGRSKAKPMKFNPTHKMIVDTEQTKESGNMGGIPMFSRIGKQTIAESMLF